MINDNRYAQFHKNFFKYYPGIKLEQFLPLQIYNKNLFVHRQRELISIANSAVGRRLLNLDDGNWNMPAVRVTPNTIVFDTGQNMRVGNEIKRVFMAKAFLYEACAKHYLPILERFDILRENHPKVVPHNQGQYINLLEHFSGLNPKSSLPEIYLDSGNFYTGAGDGSVENNTEVGSGSNWSTCRSAATGYTARPTNASNGRGIAATYKYSSFFAINREFYPIDLSSLGAGTTFQATSTLKVWGVQTDGTTNFVIVMVPTSQASNTTLTTADFDQVTYTAYSDTPTVNYNMAGAYVTLTLNSTGRGALDPTGFNQIGIVNYTYDFVGTEPAVNGTWVQTYYSEQTGTSNDPYYTLTYTLPPGVPDSMLLMGVGI